MSDSTNKPINEEAGNKSEKATSEKKFNVKGLILLLAGTAIGGTAGFFLGKKVGNKPAAADTPSIKE